MSDSATRYMDVKACAVYLGRTEKAVRNLVDRGEIPLMRVGRKVQFDRARIDAWMSRHAERGAMV